MNLSVFQLLTSFIQSIHNYLSIYFKLFIFVSSFLIASSCCICVLLWVSRIYDKFYMFFWPFKIYAYNYSRFYFCFSNQSYSLKKFYFSIQYRDVKSQSDNYFTNQFVISISKNPSLDAVIQEIYLINALIIFRKLLMSSKANPKVYMDIQIGSKGAGRMIFQLFTDFTPKTTQNFRGLCTAQYSRNDTNSKLNYQNSKFHRVVPGFVIQGGDITNGDGTGGYSIYGRTFNDENFARKHSSAGILSMANCGRNTNSSQFFITLKACPDLDDKHVVFGQLIDGIQVLRQIAKVPVDKKDKPRVPVIIVGCGQIGDFKSFLTFDPFQKSTQQKIRAKRQQIIKDQHLMRKLISEGIDPNQAYNYKRKLEKCQKDLSQLLRQQKMLELQAEQREAQQRAQQKYDEQQQIGEQPDANISAKLRERLGQKNVNKLLDLKLKMNQAKVQNSKAAVEQQIRQNDMNYKKMLKKKQYEQHRQQTQKQLIAKGLNKQKHYLNRNSIRKQKQQKQDQSFGWNVFGEQATYGAYQKRCVKLTVDKQRYKYQMENPNAITKPTEEALNELVSGIQKEEEKRSQFSRRRVIDQDDKVDYINDRNRVFNKKLDRSYGKYTANIKTALQMTNNTK